LKAVDQKTIALLQEDIKGEHAAIVQYLRHAYSFPEGEYRAELEAIAREEMWHLKWLAERVVELGGTPTLERGAAVFTGPITDLLALDVKAEEDAIALYRQHQAVITDEKTRALIERIISDEEAHRGQFTKLLEEVRSQAGAAEAVSGEAPAGGQAAPGVPEAGSAASGMAAAFLAQDVRHEYTAVLRYLFHSFTTEECEVADDMEEKAIEEMKHLGWLAEKLVDLGGQPEMEREVASFATGEKELLAEEIADEAKAIADYERQSKEVTDPGLKALLERIAYHEKVHQDSLSARQKVNPAEKEAASPAGYRLTVGSLLGKEQN